MRFFFKNLIVQRLISGILIFLIFISSVSVIFFLKPKPAAGWSVAGLVGYDSASSGVYIKAAAAYGLALAGLKTADAAVVTASTAVGVAVAATVGACGAAVAAKIALEGIFVLGVGHITTSLICANAAAMLESAKGSLNVAIAAQQTARQIRDEAYVALQAAGKSLESQSFLLQRVGKIAWAMFRKMLIDYMTDEIIKWIQGEGDPSFVTDWKGFAKTITEQTAAMTLQEVVGKEFMAGLCQSDWAIKIKISLGKPKTFRTRAMCTFKDIEKNFNKFMDNFSNGGWTNWISVTEAQNNPYGLYLMVLNEKLERQSAALTAFEKKAAAGGGFLGDEVCLKKTCILKADGSKKSYIGEFKKEDAEFDSQYSTCACDRWQTKTPGSIAVNLVSKGISKDSEFLINNPDIESSIVAIVDALINRLIKEGIAGITSQDVSPEDDSYGSPGSPRIGDYMDTTPAITTASVFDQWRVQITSSEPVTIYYTLDNTEPTTSSSIYINPIMMATTNTLKWFSVDNWGNQEGVHEMTFNPPFTVVGVAFSTTALAVSSNSISLISSSPAGVTIYYTLDGTTPTLSSSRYIKKIDVSIAASIRWFGVNSVGTQEEVQSVTASPPFPNLTFPAISDLVTPIANISAPATSQANNFFRLNPSGSADNDSTPRIVMYEWDFDNDGNYDWWIVDWNRDGVFDETQCRSGAICVEPSSGILNGFMGMQVPTGAAAGIIDVKYQAGFARQMGLRVTDDEGLYSTTNVVIDVQ